jgi:hypothetical protein
MSVADALRKMAAAGLTLDQAADIIESLGEPRARSAGAERQARYRERMKARDVTSDVTSDASQRDPALPSSSPEKVSPKPPSKINPSFNPPTHGAPDGALDELFNQAWKACTQTMRQRSSQAKSKTAWTRAAAKIEPERLLAALKRYRSEDRDVERSGGPGFHIWLNDQKYEHWLPKEANGVVVEPVSPFIQAERIQHYRDTGEWRSAWGTFPGDLRLVA